MTVRPSREESARLLRQRMEMGAVEVFLDGLTRAEALALLRVAREEGAASAKGAQPAKGAQQAKGAPPAKGGGPAAKPPPRVAQPPSAAAPLVPGASRPATSEGPAKPTAKGSTASKPGPVAADTYDSLRSQALECTRCRLCSGRTQVVFSDGPPNARLMVVGEAPGAQEDATGLPFVGAAGQYLDLLLAAVDLSRSDSVYIANVLKCRPPGNRDPLPDEIEACSPYLLQQIDFVRPRALLAVGSFSGRLLTGKDVALGKLRGQVHSCHGVPLIVTYHPAALLRNGNWTRSFWEDLQLLRGVIDRT